MTKLLKSKIWNGNLRQTKAQSNFPQIKKTLWWLQRGKTLNKNSWKSSMILKVLMVLIVLIVLQVLKNQKLKLLIPKEHPRRRGNLIYSQILKVLSKLWKKIRNPKSYSQKLRWQPCSTQRTFLWSKIRALHSYKTSQ